MRNLRKLKLIMVFVLLIVVSCSEGQASTPSTTATTITVTTPATPITTTTTTLPIGLGIDLVGKEFYYDGVPVYRSDYELGVDPSKDYLDGVGFNLPPGEKIRAPFDGYLTVFTSGNWSTIWGPSVGRMWVVLFTEASLKKADVSDKGFYIQTTPLNVKVPQGKSANRVPVRAGEVIVVATDMRKELPFRVRGLTMFITFSYFKPDSGLYEESKDTLWKFFPYVGTGPEVRP